MALGKDKPIGYTYSDYDVSNDKISVEQLYDIKRDILGSAVDSWVDADGETHGLVYNKKSKNNFALDTSAFQNENRSIVNATNLIQTISTQAQNDAQTALKIFNQILGNTNSATGQIDFNKLITIMGKTNIIDGLLDYYTNGLGFNTTSFKGLYKEYTQAEIKNGAVDLIPLNSILNSGDIIKDETGTYYKISSQALVNDGADAKPTIADWKAAGVIEDMSIPNQGDVNLNGVLYRGEYTVGESYTKNDLFYKDDAFYLVIKDGTATADFDKFKDNVKLLGGGSDDDSTVPGITYDII